MGGRALVSVFSKASAGIRFLTGIALCVLVRLIPHPPNFEPVLGFTLPFGRKYGAWVGLGCGRFTLLARMA